MKEFIEVFGKAIEKRAKGKVCCHLTGGHDTRAILSVLLYLDKEFDVVTLYSPDGRTSKEDLEIAKKIATRFGLNHIIVKCRKGEEGSRLMREAMKEYDAVFSGALMSEYLNMWNLHNINRGYQKASLCRYIPSIYSDLKENNNLCVPMLEPEVIESWKKVPPKFKHNCIIQKAIIRHYYPSLLEFPFTKSYVTFGFRNKFIQIKDKVVWIVKHI